MLARLPVQNKSPFDLDARPLNETASPHAGLLATSRAFRSLKVPDLIAANPKGSFEAPRATPSSCSGSLARSAQSYPWGCAPAWKPSSECSGSGRCLPCQPKPRPSANSRPGVIHISEFRKSLTTIFGFCLLPRQQLAKRLRQLIVHSRTGLPGGANATRRRR